MPGMLGSGGIQIRWLGMALAALTLAGTGRAQTGLPIPLIPPSPSTSTNTTVQPGSLGWPGLAPPTVPPAQPPGVPVDELRSPGTPPPLVDSTIVVDSHLGPTALPPLPGTIEDNLMREYDARRLFTYCTWPGTRITAFPTTLLWEPPLADKRAPRMQVLGSAIDNYRETWTLDTSIGGTVGFWRIEPTGRDLELQLDLFAVVHSRLSPEDLIGTDYRFGVPLTARWGPWQGRVAYEHTSSHLGDEFMRNTGRLPINYAKDEVVVGVGRHFLDCSLRVYGNIGYAFFQDLALDPDRWRFDAGAQWFMPNPTGFSGTPYAAVHVESRGEVKYNPSLNTQVGWLWHNPFQRLAMVRVFGEYYTGRAPYGQFFRDREEGFAVGFAGDF